MLFPQDNTWPPIYRGSMLHVSPSGAFLSTQTAPAQAAHPFLLSILFPALLTRQEDMHSHIRSLTLFPPGKHTQRALVRPGQCCAASAWPEKAHGRHSLQTG